MNNSSNKDTKTIGSVIKAVQIIEEIAKSDTGLGVTEISNKLNYGVSATYHLLNTLKLCNIIEQDKKTKKYRIGFALFRISAMARRQNLLANIAQPYLEELMEQIGETANLVVLDGDEAVYIAQAESNKLVKMFTKIGARVPFYCTGAGKVLLAHQPKNMKSLILEKTQYEKFTNNTITSPKILAEEFEYILNNGYAIDNEEREEGVTCIAAPVYNSDGEVIAALSISGPTYRLKAEEIDSIIESVVITAKELSRSLGHID